MTRLVTSLVLLMAVIPRINADSLVKPDIVDDETFSETFSLFVDLKSAGYLYGQIGITNIGPGDENGICRLLLVLPDQEPQNHTKIVAKNQWNFVSDKVDRLSIDEHCYLEAGKNRNLKFSAQVNEHKLMMEFTSPAAKYVVPFNRQNSESNFYQYEILTPWSEVKLDYQVAGREAVSSNGFGYADHSRSTYLPAKLAEKWVRFRSISNGDSSLLQVRFAPSSAKPQGWSWYQEKGKPSVIDSLGLTNLDNNQWLVNVEDSRGKHVIKSSSLLFRHAPLEEKGLLGIVIAKFVGNPITYTYRASINTALGEEQTGIMEISIVQD